jgi:hypothetical protein
MERWSFIQNADDKWCWRRSSQRGGVLAEGSIWFTTKQDCIVDAIYHGYVPTARPADQPVTKES